VESRAAKHVIYPDGLTRRRIFMMWPTRGAAELRALGSGGDDSSNRWNVRIVRGSADRRRQILPPLRRSATPILRSMQRAAFRFSPILRPLR